MYTDGLVYKGNRICNWCVKHQTNLADLETKYEERIDPLYYIKYGPFVLATVRPETKFGDTAVAVNPKDKRYQKYIGQEIEAEGLLGKFKLKVIGDDAVDPEFGTGAVKVTPAHDPVDYDIWQRHKDEIPGPKQVIDSRGKMDLPGTKYHGLKVAQARKLVAEDLVKAGLMDKIDETYKHNVQVCYKCNNTIEPLIMPQWYVAMTKAVGDKSSLRDMAVAAVKSGKTKILPAKFEKVFMHWMNNIRDWPISRKTWWGIPIPVWYKDEEIKISAKSPGEGWTQDPDTFDTWFSSGQWPFATLMANQTNDFKNFYPTQVMETGWDILFFWVARMMMFGLYKTGQVPFETVYLHGLVRDKDKQKMSKSKGNVVDPLGVIDQYGVDALRMALTVGNLPGNDLPLSEDRVRGYRNFSNKIWNASRFVLQNTEELRSDLNKKDSSAERSDLLLEDQKILDEIAALAQSVTAKMDKYDFAHASEDLYHYFWHTFADKTIEAAKARLADPKTKASTQQMLKESLETLLKLLHPFVPFVTEAIWQLEHKDLLMIQKWPKQV
jgi:valyl-tRNA synthetase